MEHDNKRKQKQKKENLRRIRDENILHLLSKKNEKSINSVDCANGRKQNEQVFFLCVTRRFSLFKVATKEKLVCLSLCRRGIVLRLGICDGVSVCVCVSFFFASRVLPSRVFFLPRATPKKQKKRG